METSRSGLLNSLENQRRRLSESIVLTPVDNLPLSLEDRRHTAFLHGLYLTDKVRDEATQKNAVVQFAGRSQAARDIAAIHKLLADTLGAATGSMRLLAGLQAHAATFMSIGEIGQSVLLLPAEAGGHFNTHAILRRLGFRTIDIPIDRNRMCVDRAATMRLIAEAKPDFIFIDRSEGLRYEDFSFLASVKSSTTIFDASQYLTPIITGRYVNPLDWGFDLVLFTLHKSFPGPQKAAIVGRENGPTWDRLSAGLSTLVSSSHAENTYLAGLTLLNRDALEIYSRRLLATSEGLGRHLARCGVAVVDPNEQGSSEWPLTHHLWIRCQSQDEAFDFYKRLSRANVQTNYRLLPYGLGYGLRLGTSFASVAGLDTEHVEELAKIIADARTDDDEVSLRSRVKQLAENATSGAVIAPESWH